MIKLFLKKLRLAVLSNQREKNLAKIISKQILTLSNNMIKNSPEFLNKSDKSIKLWHDCNNDVLEQLKKLNKSTSHNNIKDSVEDETGYNFDEILHDTELNNNEQNLDGKNLHDLYRHSTKLIK